MSAKLLDELLKKLRFNIEDVIKSDLSEVILYGSYARGDFDEESDIDIAVIVDSSRELLRKYHKGLVEIMTLLLIFPAYLLKTLKNTRKYSLITETLTVKG